MDAVLSQIYSDLHKNKLSHAILIDGGDAQTREKTARKAAQALVCSGDEQPCGVCPHCIKASADSHADILVFSGGTTPGSFKVDMVREIRRHAGVLPNEAAVKVFILLSCETMLDGAQNALLKVLEEPPQHVRFILTCSAASDLLDTILSRVTVYSLHSADHFSDSEQEDDGTAAMILQAIANEDEEAVVRITAKFEKDKEGFVLVCRSLIALSSQVMTHQITDDPAESVVHDLAYRLYSTRLLHIIQTTSEILQAIQGNLNGNLLLSVFCSRLFADSDEGV